MSEEGRRTDWTGYCMVGLDHDRNNQYYNQRPPADKGSPAKKNGVQKKDLTKEEADGGTGVLSMQEEGTYCQELHGENLTCTGENRET